MISDCEIVEIWHTIFLDFTCSLDIMEKVISKKFFILYFVSNLLKNHKKIATILQEKHVAEVKM